MKNAHIIYNIILDLLVYFLIIIFSSIFTRCNQKINNAISINYQILKEDTCQYFCYKEVITVYNNTNDSFYFFEPDWREKNKLGIVIPYFLAPSDKEGYYNKQHFKFLFDKTSADFLDSNKISERISNVSDKNRFNEERRFKDSLYIIYLTDYMLLNNIIELSKADSSRIRSIVDDAIPYFFLLLKPHDTLIYTRNANILVKMKKRYILFYKCKWGIKKKKEKEIHKEKEVFIDAKTKRMFIDDAKSNRKYRMFYPDNIAGYKKFTGKMKSNKLVIKGDRIIKNKPVPKRFRYEKE